MAEVRPVSVERVAEVTPVSTYVDKHTVGIRKAVRVKSWRRGIEAREGKLERINISTEISRGLFDLAISYAREKGIPYVPGINGLAYEYLRLMWLGFKEEAEAIKNSVPSEWHEYFTRAEMFIDKYDALRKVRV
jgi:hypothetical protein